MKSLRFIGSMLVILLAANSSYSQSSKSIINEYLSANKVNLGLSNEDINDWIIYDEYVSKKSGINHVYIRQRHEGIELFNAVANFSIKANKIVHVGNRLEKGIAAKVNTTQAVLTPMQAIDSAAQHLGIIRDSKLKALRPISNRYFVFDGGSVSLEDIPVKLMFYPVHNEDNDIRLVWNLSIYEVSKDHWWSIRVDAVTGEVLDKLDWVVACTFEGCEDPAHTKNSRRPISESSMVSAPAPPPGTDEYRVYALPLESPNHGASTLVVGPSDATASPFGWHDTNGAAGAESTLTRGNNVIATEDQNGNNGVGSSPDGGAALSFDFPVNLTNAPATYEDAAITNLFYMNNIMHDVWYQYGFDEPAGNFQENAYGNGGLDSDRVIADAQDGSGTNNANFATPGDGGNPRMQMYLWTTGPGADIDGDLDNGIIAHEYGHGISNRLAGGPSASGCLSNDEQMGEGWSDWFGLMLTIEPGDLGPDGRGIGTFAMDEAVTGPGIRPARYSTDFGVNNFTYDATNNTGAISQPHGIGFVWCTMIWDLSWAMIDTYGYDPDLYNGTGGNNMAMHLIIEGLKLQPCSPGFVDGRDGILAADQALYGGANQCLIWEVFANRGLGFSADQGNTNSRTDQVEAFDLPLICLTPTVPPNAEFSFVSDCNGTVDFTDLSTLIPEGWSWDFGDATTSTAQNPSHTYSASATYTVTLIATNSIGADTISHDVTVVLPTAPVVGDESICENQTATFTGTASGSIIWYDATGTIPLDTATTYTTPVLTTTTTYQVENVLFGTLQNVGPLDASFGSSGYHDQPVDFTLNFTAYAGFTLLSVWIDAGSTGNRTINIWDAIDGGGSIIASTTVNITATGPQRIPINLEVPTAGTYSVGGTGMDLRRNNGGVSYPYTLTGVVDIISSSAGADYYYYYYDWEVQTLPCRSAQVPVNAIVVLPDSTFETVSACDSYTWSANSTTYTSSGSYIAAFTNVTGCDSIKTLNLTVGASTTGSETVNICDSYTWPTNSTTYTSSGSYTATLTNATGCDSVVTLNLTIGVSTAVSETVNTCGSYTWSANATTYTSSGNYVTTLTNAAGCDSIATLNLTIGTSNSGNESVAMCDSYTWSANSTTYTSSGSYTATLTNASGCDSVATLNLTIATSNSGSESVAMCDSYTWSANSTTYTSSGSYTATLTNAAGCDSVATLNLTISASSSGSETVNACNSYTWSANATAYTTSGTYMATLTNAAGCDSVATLNLTIAATVSGSESVSACDSYTWSADGTTYSTTGTYTALLTSVGGCDSTATLNLTINTVDNGVTPSGNTVLSANASGAQYQWIDCDTGLPIAGETGQTYTATSTGNYAVIVTENGCSDTSACTPITIVGLDDAYLFTGVSVFPNPTLGEVNIHLGGTYEQVNIQILDVTGKVVSEYFYPIANEIILEINEAPGVYFIEISLDNGLSKTVKIYRE